MKSHGKGVARLKLSQLISYEQVTDWVYHLITERLLSASSVNVAVSAVRFLYAVTLGRVTVWSFGSIQPDLGNLSRFGNPLIPEEVHQIREPIRSSLRWPGMDRYL